MPTTDHTPNHGHGHGHDLPLLTLAQLEALAKGVDEEKIRRWELYATHPALFRDAAADLPTDWLERLVARDAWEAKWREFPAWEAEVHRIVAAELERRQGQPANG
jgi:hypothetical protein